MDDATGNARAPELGLTPAELAEWTPQLSDGTVSALLANLIRFEDALAELPAGAAEARTDSGAPPGAGLTGAEVLNAADLRFINLVAVRRFTEVDQPPPPEGLEEALDARSGSTAFTHAASLAAALLDRHVFGAAPQHTALLAMCCQLELDGYQLLAPQGVAAGMIRGVAAGEVDVDTVARWLEDRAVQTRFPA